MPRPITSVTLRNRRACKNAYIGGTVTKPDAGQAFQAASFLLCVSLALKLTNGVAGTEFSGAG